MTGGDQIPSEVHPPPPYLTTFMFPLPTYFHPLLFVHFSPNIFTPCLTGDFETHCCCKEEAKVRRRRKVKRWKRFATQRRHHWGFKDAPPSLFVSQNCQMYLSKLKEGFVQFRNVFGQWIFLFVGKSKRFATQRRHHQGFKDAFPSLWLRSSGQISTVFATHPFYIAVWLGINNEVVGHVD